MTPAIEIAVPTMQLAGACAPIASNLNANDVAMKFIHNTPESNLGVLGSFQAGYERTTAPVIAYLHDDVTIRDSDWAERVLAEFADPQVGVVGFCGALRHGHVNLYKVPYQLVHLARYDVLSNMDDAEVHGARFAGVCDVAVLDGFALIVRRKLLAECGGWLVHGLPAHHNYDYLICCLAHRFGYRVRLVGVPCHHAGGRTATTPAYQEWAKRTQWGSDVEMHIQGHRVIYDNFSDVLPWSSRHEEN